MLRACIFNIWVSVHSLCTEHQPAERAPPTTGDEGRRDRIQFLKNSRVFRNLEIANAVLDEWLWYTRVRRFAKKRYARNNLFAQAVSFLLTCSRWKLQVFDSDAKSLDGMDSPQFKMHIVESNDSPISL